LNLESAILNRFQVPTSENETALGPEHVLFPRAELFHKILARRPRRGAVLQRILIRNGSCRVTRGRKIDRDGQSVPSRLGFACLAALFLISGLVPQATKPGPSGSGSTAQRGAGSPLSEEADSPSPTGSQPTEDDSHGRHLGDLGNAPSPRLTRAGNRPPAQSGLFDAPGDLSGRPTIRRERANPSPRASGRALRHWLQSQTC
jgi:hypothetical protein